MYLTNYNITIFSGSPTEFLEHYIFPILLPALEDMLRAAKLEKCFEVCQKNVFSLSPKLNSLLFMFLEKLKVVFFVPTAELANQQLTKIKDYIPIAWIERVSDLPLCTE